MDDFDDFVLSYNVGYSKLEMKFYKVLIKKLKCEPPEAVFIDDHQEFIDMGKSQGLNGILSKDIEQIKSDLHEYGY